MEPGCSDEHPGCLFAAAQTRRARETTLGARPTDQVTTMKTETGTEQLRDVYTDRGPADPALAHAVVRTDHQQARVLEFAAAQVQSRTLHLHAHPTSQHHSNIRAEHEFFGAVCDALDGIGQVLITGTHTALADFRHYADKHRPLLAARIAGYELVDHPSDHQLVALARRFFQQQARLDGDGLLRA